MRMEGDGACSIVDGSQFSKSIVSILKNQVNSYLKDLSDCLYLLSNIHAVSILVLK